MKLQHVKGPTFQRLLPNEHAVSTSEHDESSLVASHLHHYHHQNHGYHHRYHHDNNNNDDHHHHRNIAMTINMAQPQTLAPQVLANDKWQMLGSILQLRYLDVSRTAIFQDDSLGGSL